MPALCVNCIPSHQGAGEGESDKEVADDTVYQLGPIRGRANGVDESEPAIQLSQSANQIPPRQFDGIGT